MGASSTSTAVLQPPLVCLTRLAALQPIPSVTCILPRSHRRRRATCIVGGGGWRHNTAGNEGYDGICNLISTYCLARRRVPLLLHSKRSMCLSGVGRHLRRRCGWRAGHGCGDAMRRIWWYNIRSQQSFWVVTNLWCPAGTSRGMSALMAPHGAHRWARARGDRRSLFLHREHTHKCILSFCLCNLPFTRRS